MTAGTANAWTWPVAASVGVHAVGIALASTVVAWTPATPPPEPAPIQVVMIDRPRPEPPRTRPVLPRPKIVAPRVNTQPTDLTPPTPLPAAALLDDAPRTTAPPAATQSPTAHDVLAGATASSSWSIARGGAPAIGALLPTGDLPLTAGRGGSGGTSATSVARGTPTGTGKADAPGDVTGLTSFARPLGGYQTRPRYPDSARREGIEGETLLRFQVLTTGKVASISVARSAGHPDLDRAAIEAVTTWLFEPARRGKDAVSVWVTLPVRFQLETRTGR